MAQAAYPAADSAMRGWRLALTVLAGSVFGLLVGAASLAVVATQFLGFGILTVTSNSMSPAIKPGDIAVVQPVAISDVGTGDVVLFTQGGDRVPVVHRVTGINEVETRTTSRSSGLTSTSVERRLVTQGDNNPLPDAETVGVADLRGRVWFTVPGLPAFAALPLQHLLFAMAGTFGTGAAALATRQALAKGDDRA